MNNTDNTCQKHAIFSIARQKLDQKNSTSQSKHIVTLIQYCAPLSFRKLTIRIHCTHVSIELITPITKSRWFVVCIKLHACRWGLR